MAPSRHTANPIDLLFGGMDKLGPGSNGDTLRVLHLLPTQHFQVIVDAGCGTGRQTLVLAQALGTRVHAVDAYAPFLQALMQRAQAAGLAPLVRTHCMDMRDIPGVFPHIDLLWSEGAAYHIGFAYALTTWASVMPPGGFVVVSELSWLRAQVPDVVRAFFASGYPAMQSLPHNRTLAAHAGYRVLATHTLPPETWVEGYYDLLEPRAHALVDHPDASVRACAEETLQEIDIFRRSDGSYGYVFYVLQRV
jgi:cyclopropane fatty-acyl-phospholipid synthase-like methyltransferase